jgi:hypothetical protein
LLDKQILKIAESPSVGTEKRGDLRGIYTYKFKIKTILHRSQELTRICS